MLSWNRNIGLQNLLVYFRDKSLINYFHFNWEWYGRFFTMHGGAENLKNSQANKIPWNEMNQFHGCIAMVSDRETKT